MKKVVIADNHPIVRKGIKHILEKGGEFSETRECKDGNELLAMMATDHFDIAIMDINLNGKNSLDILKETRRNYPGTPVIIFSQHCDENFMIKVLQLGAAAFITKDLPAESIMNILKKVLIHKRFISDEQARKIAGITIDSDNSSPGLHTLSPREYQLLKEIASGIKYDEIASKLGMSKNTIANHRMNILKKLKLKNNSDITRFALKTGVID